MQQIAACTNAMSSDRVNPIFGIIEWLSGDESHALDDAGLVRALGNRLVQAGIPLHRLTLHLTTLHPELVGRTIAWSPGEPVEIHDRERSAWRVFSGSPIFRAMTNREIVIVDANADDVDHWQSIDIFAGRRLRQLVVAPLCNADGPVSVAGFGTRDPGGFDPLDFEKLTRILPALRTACELRVLRQAELSLLDTYIGPMTAQRILAGRIRRGDVESIEAALLLCDLRGFTELSNKSDPTRVFEILNGYFERVIPTVGKNGGEVLKFMGDAVLAFFPGHDELSSCRAALSSARQILSDLDRVRFAGLSLSAGVALHYGNVSYGNIGAGRRLDFTLIGPDINMLSRIQGVCSELKQNLLMSSTFNSASGANGLTMGFHKLKGFEDTVELYADGTVEELA